MPNCFQLTRKGKNGQLASEPSDLSKIDTEMWCRFEGEEPKGNEKWYKNWFNTIGLLYALGKTTEEVLEEMRGSDLHTVALFLHANFEVRAWYSPRR